MEEEKAVCTVPILLSSETSVSEFQQLLYCSGVTRHMKQCKNKIKYPLLYCHLHNPAKIAGYAEVSSHNDISGI